MGGFPSKRVNVDTGTLGNAEKSGNGTGSLGELRRNPVATKIEDAMAPKRSKNDREKRYRDMKTAMEADPAYKTAKAQYEKLKEEMNDVGARFTEAFKTYTKIKDNWVKAMNEGLYDEDSDFD